MCQYKLKLTDRINYISAHLRRTPDNARKADIKPCVGNDDKVILACSINDIKKSLGINILILINRMNLDSFNAVIFEPSKLLFKT